MAVRRLRSAQRSRSEPLRETRMEYRNDERHCATTTYHLGTIGSPACQNTACDSSHKRA